MQLLIQLTARNAAYRKGLSAAAAGLRPQEAAIMADLERHGLQVPQLDDLLCGGHVLVDDPDLYEQWRFPEVSHHRLSSHHRNIDKDRYPDIGMCGPVVREKLHGRTAHGTWLQLEKTPAAFGRSKLPSLNDLRHLMDYVVYRITRSNVGPWGLSRVTERRPMYLSPALALAVAIGPDISRTLTATLRDLAADEDRTSVSADLAWRFPPPERAKPTDELGRSIAGRGGRGLFGNSQVWVSEAPLPSVAEVLFARSAQPGALWTDSDGGTMNDAAWTPDQPGGPGAPSALGTPGTVSVPEGMVAAVVSLVQTRAVPLGAYTIAELTVVDAVVDFLESRPSDEVLAEAARSLAARQLLVGGGGDGQLQVRGDLGITLAFQRRARAVLDVRVTGTAPGEPWRVLVLPQPEGVCLLVRIDALGVHEVSLNTLDDTLRILAEWLPRGPWAEPADAADPDQVLAAAERSALLSAIEYSTVGSAETAESTTDLVLAQRDGRLHAFVRDPADPARLLTKDDGRTHGVRDAVTFLLGASALRP